MPDGFTIPPHLVDFQTTGHTRLTLPTTGTVSTNAGTATLSGKTLANPTITNPVITSITPLVVTTASTTLNATIGANRPIVLDRATGIAATLPLATGTGNSYPFVIKTTFTGAATIVSAQATDLIAGNAILHDTDDTTVHGFSVTNATTVTLYGASNATGGIIGGKIVFTDAATNLWIVEYQSNAAASPSTPFS